MTKQQHKRALFNAVIQTLLIIAFVGSVYYLVTEIKNPTMSTLGKKITEQLEKYRIKSKLR